MSDSQPRKRTWVCYSSISVVLILVLIVAGNIFEENLFESRLTSWAEHLTVASARINFPENLGPSFYDIYSAFIEEHDKQYLKSIDDKARICSEYEPFVYTDDIRLNYRIDGLSNISVGQVGSFKISTFGNLLPGSNKEFLRIVFYGIAVLAPQSLIGDSTGCWSANFNISDAGIYRVYVESVYRLNRTKHLYRAIEGSPFNLLVRPKGSEQLRDEQVLDAMPVKDTQSAGFPIVGTIAYPRSACPDAGWRPGRWLRCHHTPEPCIRTGWIWVPESCFFRIFTANELRRLPQPLWIVFAGTSVQRGTFLSAADTVLQPGALNANLTNDRVWRCWGWMDLAYRGLRLSYVDLRFSRLFDGGAASLAFMEPQYTAHAVVALSRLGRLDGRGPDVFYLEGGDDPSMHEPYLVKSWLGYDWPGRFIVHPTKPCPAADFCGERLALASRIEPPRAFAWAAAHPQSGMECADESHMAYAFMQEQVITRNLPVHSLTII